jgi:hypothetical protein
MIKTYNSKPCTYGNRLNLVVNTDNKEVYFTGSHAYDLGNVHNDLGIREANRLYKEYIQDGFKRVSHADVRDNWTNKGGF